MRTVLFLLMTLSGLNFFELSATALGADGRERILRFPKTHSVGRVYYSDWITEGRPHDEIVEPTGPTNFYDWKLIGEAHGDVHVPENSIVRFKLNVGTARNLSWVSRLKPDDIYEFEINPYLPQEKLKVGDADVRYLKRLTGLARLSLYHVDVSDKGLSFLKSMKGLKMFGYYSPKLGNQGLKTIGEINWLEELSLGKAKWNDTGLQYLSGLKSLRRLGLSTVDVQGPGLAVCSRLPRLESFSSQQYVTDRHLSYLKDATTLRDLYIADASISDKGLQHISNLSNLESLNLSGARGFTNVGLKHLVRNQKLKRLNIINLNSRNKHAVTSEDLSFVARLQHLEHLQLPSSGITEDILETVSQLRNLKHFWGGVERKQTPSDEAVQKLTRLKNLEYLHLNTSGISEKALGYIGGISSLKILHQPNVLDGSNNSLRQLSGLKSLEVYSAPKKTSMSLAALNHLGELSNIKTIDASGILPPETDDPLLDLSGLKHLEKILLPDVRDDDLACLADCTKLIDLQVGMQKTISDEGLAHVARLNGLHGLTIGGPGVTDAGLQYLAGKNNLYSLTLKGHISSKGFGPIRKLKMLSSLNIHTDQRISPAAKNSLIRALPNLYSLNLTNGPLGEPAFQKKKKRKKNNDVSVRETSFNQEKAVSEKPALSRKARVLHFPKDRSVGRVYYSRWISEGRPHDALVEPTGPTNFYDWKLIGEAQGDVRVPENTIVRFTLNVGTARNLSWISRLKPDDIYEFEINPHIAALRLKVGDRDVQHLKSLTGLTRLYLTHVDVSDSGLTFLKSMKGLKALGVFSPKLGNRGLKTIGELSHLEELNLGKGTWDDAGLLYLSGLKLLRRINFSTIDVKGPGMAFLEKLPVLEFLSVEISDRHLQYFDQASSLRELRVDGGEITDTGLQLISNLHNLEGLSLGANPYITDNGMTHLKKLKKLRRLNLINCNSYRKSAPITIEGLSHLGDMKTLEHLDLPSRHIPEEVLEVVSQLPNLKKFWGGVGMKQPLSDEAVKKLTRLKHLEFLHLNTSGISEEALGYIGEIDSLKKFHTPKILGGTDESFKQLSSLHNLEHLTIPLNSNLSVTALNYLDQLTELKLLHANYLKPPAPEAPRLDLSNLKKLDFVMLPAVRDEDLACLKNCQQLTRLQVVPQTSISDVGMAALANMKRLELVTIGGPGVTDKSLDYLEGKKSLSGINLTGNFTNQGVASLKRFRNLWSVRIHSANQISSAVQKRLARSLPHLWSMQITNDPLIDESAQIKSEPKIRLVSHERKVRKIALQTAEKVKEAPVSNRKARTLRFPKDRSVGQVYIAFEKEEEWFHRYMRANPVDSMWKWKLVGNAKGNVSIPEGALVKFKLNASSAKNMSWISKLRPDDLYEFEIRPSLPGNHFKVGDNDVRHLRHLTELASLRLSFVDVSDRGLGFLDSLKSLQRFNIYSRKLGNQGVAKIGEQSSLTYLHLAQGKWDDRGLRHLANLRSLRYLGLMTRDVKGPGLKFITRLPLLETFTSSGEGFQDKHLAYLKTNRTIQNLLLPSTDITNVGLKHISEMAQLKYLNLYRVNTYSDAGLAFLKELKSLKRLNISWANHYRKLPPITTDGIAHLTELKTLEHLNLPKWKMTADVFELVAHLENLKWLHIGLNGHEMPPPLSAKSVEHLTKLRKLEVLQLYDKSMEAEALTHIGSMTNLRVLSFPKVENLPNESLAKLNKLTGLVSLNLPTDTGMTLSVLNQLRGMTELKALAGHVDSPSPNEEALNLSQMTKLETLSLPGLRDQDLACLRHCTNLNNLQIYQPGPISDQGMAHLANLRSLELLTVAGTGITDKSLRYLEDKNQLYSLRIQGDFTEQGVMSLKKFENLSSLRIHTLKKLRPSVQRKLANALPNLYTLVMTNGPIDDETDKGTKNLPKVKNVSLPKPVKKQKQPDSAKPQVSQKARVLRFPKDRSVGQVYIAFEKQEPFSLHADDPWEQEWDWKRIGEAQGNVTIPEGAKVRFKLSIATARNLFWLSKLKSDDLYSFEIYPFVSKYYLKVADKDLKPLQHLTGLTRLMLVQVDLKGEGLEILDSMPALKKLYINSPKLQNAGLELIGKAKGLEYLSLAAGKWNDRGLRHLKKLKSLQAISMSVRDVRGPGLMMIASLPKLQAFSCQGSEFEDRHAFRLKRSTSIKNVLIPNSGITNTGLNTMSEMGQLEHLNLSYCHGFTDGGLASLIKLKNLRQLELRRVNQYRKKDWITSVGIDKLVQIQTLEDLVLPEYEMPDEVFAQVSQLKNLKSLVIGRGMKKTLKPITAEMVLPLTKLSRLESLKINDKGMEVEGLSVLGKIDSLKSLTFPTVRNMKNEDLARLNGLKSLRKLQIPFRTQMTLSALNQLKALTEMRYFFAYVKSPAQDEEVLDISHMTRLKTILLPDIRDEDLACLANCQDLEVLQMGFQNTLSDVGMRHITGLHNLKELHIGGPGVTDKGLQYLEGKHDLYSLHIKGDFSKEGLEPIRHLTGLVRLHMQTPQKLNTDIQQSLARPLTNLYTLNMNYGPIGEKSDKAVQNNSQVKNISARKPVASKKQSSSEKPHASRKARVLHFPKDRAVGQVFIAFEKEAEWHDRYMTPSQMERTWVWKLLGEARGDVRIPAGAIVKFKLNASTARNLTWVSRLKSDDLYEFEINPYIPKNHFRVGNRDVRHLSHLTGLTRLTLEKVDVTGSGLKFLESLTSLKWLRVHSPKLDNRGLAQIGKLKSLEYLHLEPGTWNDEGMVHLSKLRSLSSIRLVARDLEGVGLEVIARLPDLVTFSSGWNDFHDRHMDYLKNSKSIKNLKLSSSKLTDAALRSISHISQLEHLNLSRTNTFTDEGLSHLKKLKNLTYLNIGNTNRYRKIPPLTLAGIKHVTEIKTLEHLSLPTDHITEEVFEQVVELEKLKRLWIGVTGKGAEKSISSKAVQHLTRLKHLDALQLTGKSIDEESLAHIGTMTNLRLLGFPGNKQLQDQSLAKLKNLTNLVSLQIPYESNVSLSALNHLKGMTEMRYLTAGSLGPPADDAEPLNLSAMNKLYMLILPEVRNQDLACLANCSELHNLQIAGINNISDKGMAHLANLSSLDNLRIGGPGVTDKGLQYLSDKPELYALSIKGNFTEQGLMSLKNNKGLVRLSIQTPQKLSPSVQKNLARVLPNLYTLRMDYGPIE